LFIQSGFGAPEVFSANLPVPVYPNATLGIRVRIEPIEGLYVQAAVFDGNPAPGLTPDRSPDAAVSNEFNRHGTGWALRTAEGALLSAEVGYRFNALEDAAEASATRTAADARTRARGDVATTALARGLAGSYKVGFLYHTDSFADIYDVTLADLASSLAPPKSRNGGSNCAIYVSAEQEGWREPGTADQGLGVFGHAAWMPRNRNFLEFSFEGGLHYRGAIPGRDKDALGLGIAFVSISDRVAAAVQAANKADGTFHTRPDFEATIELVYRYQAAAWFSIQPHAQYVIQPGGTKDLGNALIIGLRTNVAF
jgi:porin